MVSASNDVDAVVVGSGPNGLAAAITLARAGRSVRVIEANDTIGGASRSAEITEPGFVHDLGSAIQPMVKVSPFFVSIADQLVDEGLTWVTPPASVAHPLDDGRAAIGWHDLERTVDGLGADGAAYRRYFSRWVDNVDIVADLALNPVMRVPPSPVFSARFGAASALPALTAARRTWSSDEARALFIGQAAHSFMPLTAPFTTSFAIVLGTLGHSHGWGFPEGGAQSIVDAMAALLRKLGGEIVTGHRVSSLDELPSSRAIVLALTPRQVERIAGNTFDEKYRRGLREFRYGPAASKVDFALDEQIPWTNPDVASAGTVHVGGSTDEIVAAEQAVNDGHHAERPFTLVAQHTLFDPTRAPETKHTAWAYCHVPNGSTIDQTEVIISQIERFAPGFRDIIRSSHTTLPADLEARNANLVGGDIGGGSYSGSQLLLRPRAQINPYSTPDPRIFISSASASPGAGIHGMSGAGAAQRALETVLK